MGSKSSKNGFWVSAFSPKNSLGPPEGEQKIQKRMQARGFNKGKTSPPWAQEATVMYH